MGELEFDLNIPEQETSSRVDLVLNLKGIPTDQKEYREYYERELLKLRTTPLNPNKEGCSSEQEFLNAVESFTSFTTADGEEHQIDILEENKVLFARTLLTVWPLLKDAHIPQYGYHALDLSEPNEHAHSIEHLKSLVLRTYAMKALFKEYDEASKVENTGRMSELQELIIAPVLGNAEGASDDLKAQRNKHFEFLKKVCENNEEFQKLIEDEMFISLFHDISEKDQEGRDGHEDRAKEFVLKKLMSESSHCKKNLEETVSIELDENGKEIKMTRLDRVLLGIDGSKMSTTIPPQVSKLMKIGLKEERKQSPQVSEDTMSELNEDRSQEDSKLETEADADYVIPAQLINSTMGRLIRGIVEVSDWERITSSDNTSVEVFDLIEAYDQASEEGNIGRLESIAETLKAALKRHAHFLLVGESLVFERELFFENKERKTSGSILQTIYQDDLDNFILKNADFLRGMREKTRPYDAWYEALSSQSETEKWKAIKSRYAIDEEDGCAISRATTYEKRCIEKPELALKLALLSALILDPSILKFEDAIKMSIEDLLAEFGRLDSLKEKQLKTEIRREQD